ncbi:hypothetical protein [Methanoregula sp.]|uniref:hypothetical protein n=1 Tax=Methanoregula sp. TaxID=2052170 RepID=UPI00236C5325|nr:hypothetical protein [Methanoregula sp.]MDD1686957.1 hypothetical protein [Methanoregula sp.]
MRHGRRRRDFSDMPWVTIAAVIGVIAVVIIAAVFFLGGGLGDSSGSASPGSSSVAPKTTLLKNTGVASITVKVTPTVSVPASGTYVEVDYLGSFTGTYGANGVLEKVQNSGNRLYTVENATGTISAKFQKGDSSKSHDLTVQIWQDGKAVKFASNRSAYGIVNIKYP